MSERKGIGRDTAIGLVIIIVVLVFALAYCVIEINNKDRTIDSLQSQINDKDKTIDSLQSELNSCGSEINSSESEISGLISKVDSLRTKVTGKGTITISIGNPSLSSEIDTLSSDIDSLSQEIDSLTSELDSLRSQAESEASQINDLQNQISSLNSQISNLQNQINSLNDIVALNQYEVLINSKTISQPAGYYTYWTFSLSYAGYVSVYVESSTTDKTFVRVVYSSYGVNYDNTIYVGTSGTAVFPVLPASNVEIAVGNSNALNGATETVTITYYY